MKRYPKNRFNLTIELVKSRKNKGAKAASNSRETFKDHRSVWSCPNEKHKKVAQQNDEMKQRKKAIV